MAELLPAEEMRNYLAALGIVRLPNTTGPLPLCWLHEATGEPQPDIPAGETAIIELRRSNFIAKPPIIAADLEEPVIECTVRATRSHIADLLQNQIRRALDSQFNFDMSALHVEWCHVWRQCFWLGSDSYSYDNRQSFRVCVTRESLGV